MRRIFTVPICLALLVMALVCTVSPVAAGYSAETYPFIKNATYPNGTPWTIGVATGIAINGTGYIFVAELGPARIRVFDPAGEQVQSWDGPLDSNFFGIAVSPDRVYVTDYYDHLLFIYTLQGTWVKTVDTPKMPCGVAINSTGHVLVACGSSDGIQVYEPDGTAAGTIGAGLESPSGLAVDGSDRLYVTERSYPRGVTILDHDGTQLRSFPFEGEVYGCALNATGTLLVPDCSTEGMFYGYTSSGTLVGQSQAGILLKWPRGIAVNGAGEAYVTSDSGRVSIFRVDPVRPTPTPTPFVPFRSFAAYPESGTAPLAVQFLDYTPNGKSWAWDFGDGGTSDRQSPVHVYTRSGLYTVSETVTDWSGNTGTKTIYHLIRVSDPVTPAPTPVADFSANATAGPAPMTVVFTDASSPTPNHRWWQFGDGSSSTDANPVHTYTTQGTYTVNLSIWTGIGQATVSKPAYITVGPDPRAPVSNFTMSRSSGKVPFIVRVTDTSTGNPTSWRWEIPNRGWSTARNATVYVRSPGTYALTLTATNEYGSSQMTKTITATGTAMRAAKGDAFSIVG
jgi:PKD repeat protein